MFRGDEPTADPVEGTVPLRRLACGSVLDGSPEIVVRPGQVSTYPEHSAVGRVPDQRPSVSLRRPAAHMDRWASAIRTGPRSTAQFGIHSVMVVPVRARGATLGIAVFVRHRRPEPFEDDDLVLAEEIVARAAVCIDNARRYTREHATALALQRSLLPRRLPGRRPSRWPPGTCPRAPASPWAATGST